MRGEREYEFAFRLDKYGDVTVEATVYGEDTPARGPSYSHGGLPPEYRDVVLTVTDEEGNDVTDDLSDDDLRLLWDEALTLDDAEQEADYWAEVEAEEDNDEEDDNA